MHDFGEAEEAKDKGEVGLELEVLDKGVGEGCGGLECLVGLQTRLTHLIECLPRTWGALNLTPSTGEVEARKTRISRIPSAIKFEASLS